VTLHDRVREVLTPDRVSDIEQLIASPDTTFTRKTWAFINNKGGVGKTFNVMALSYALAEFFGLHVLVVDMDPQGNATRRAGHSSAAMTQVSTLVEALKMNIKGSAEQIRLPVRWDNMTSGGSVDILPSRLDLENRVVEAATADAVRMVEQMVRQEAPALQESLGPILKQVRGSLNHPRERLRNIMDGVHADHDLILIDCPPSLGHLTQNAYCAADGVLLCVKADYDSVNGAARTRDVLHQDRSAMGVPRLDVHGVLLTDLQRTGRTDEANGLAGTFTAAQESIEDLRGIFGDLLWTPFLERRSVLAQNTDYGVPIVDELRGKDLRYVSDVLIHWSSNLLEVSRG
jgi:cellulose biosynthesis protein BcsQ